MTFTFDADGSVDLARLSELAGEDVLAPEDVDASGTLTFGLAATGTPRAPQGRVSLNGAGVVVRDIALQTFEANADGDAELVRLDGVRVVGDFGDVTLSGVFDPAENTLADGRVKAVVGDLGALLRMAGMPEGWSGAVTVEGDVAGDLDDLAEERTDSLRGNLQVNATGIAAPDGPIGDVTARVDVQGSQIRVEQLAVDGPDATLRAAATYDTAGGTVTLAPFDVQVGDLGVLKRVSPDLDLGGSLNARGELRATVGETLERLALSADVEGTALRHGATAIGDVTARVRTDGTVTTFEHLGAKGPWGSANAALDVRIEGDSGSAHVTRLDGEVLADGRTFPLRLRAPIDASWQGQALRVDAFDVEALGGRVSGAAAGDATALNATLSLDAVDLAALARDVSGLLSGEVRIGGTRAAPELAADVEIPELRVSAPGAEDLVATVSVRATQPPGGLVSLDELRVDAGELLTVTGSGTLPVGLTGDGVNAPSGRVPTLAIRAESASPAALFARAGAPDLDADAFTATIDGDASGLRAAIVASNLRAAGGEEIASRMQGDTKVDVVADGSGIVARFGAPEGGPASARGEVRVAAPFDWTSPDTAALESAALNGEMRVDVPELEAIADLVPGLARLEGALGIDVTIGGTTSVPQVNGKIEGTSLAAKLESDTPSLEEATFRATFDTTKIDIAEFGGQLGYAPISVTGSLPLQPGAGEADLVIKGENTLLMRSTYLRLRSDLDLRVTGPFESLLVAGKVTITDGLFSQPIDLFAGSAPTVADRFQIFSVRDPPLSTTRFDIKIKAAETFRVDNNLLRGAFGIDLHLGGTGEVPEPEGRVDFREARVKLPFSRLIVDRGAVVFPKGQPFDPRIEVAANTRMRGYELNVQVEGPIDETRVHVTSMPPLPPESAQLLLVTGSTAEELERDGIGSAALSKAGGLLGGAVLSWISGPGDPDEESLADRVTVEFGRDISRSGAATIDAELKLAERWFLHGERDRYDDVNVGLLWRFRFR